jgi:hypothetical protein
MTDTAIPALVESDNTSGMSAGVIAQDVAAAVSTPQGQKLEDDLTSGLPRVARGIVYSVGGGLAAVGSSLVSYDLANPGVMPHWLSAAGAILSPILAAFTGGTAWANLGKK